MRQTTPKFAPARPALLLLLALSACAEATDVDAITSEGRCATCHLSSAADAGTSVAHLRHLTAGTLGGPFVCADCHAVPATVTATGHRDGQVGLSFSARAGGATAQWNPAQQTCAVACHGTAAPVWTVTDGTHARCGSCHGLPPASGHPGINPAAGCGACHPATVRADGTIDVAGGAHLNGQPDFITNPACGACHGIPPTSGLHVLHVTESQIACAICHAGATETNPGPAHLNGAVEVSLPGWPTTRSCANVCHGPGRW